MTVLYEMILNAEVLSYKELQQNTKHHNNKP